jgi:antitoxin ParD1/3/4
VATTSLSLGEHWEVFIRNEISSGRYGSASEVVRSALRVLEERKTKLEALRAHLAEGAAQTSCGEYGQGYSVEQLIDDADAGE